MSQVSRNYIYCTLSGIDCKKPSDMVSEGFSKIPLDQVKRLHKWLLDEGITTSDILFYFTNLGMEYTWMEGASDEEIHRAMFKVFNRGTEYSMPVYHKLTVAIEKTLK